MVQAAVEGAPVASVDATGDPSVDAIVGGGLAHGEGTAVPSGDVIAEISSAHANGTPVPSVAPTVTGVLPSFLVVPSVAGPQVEGGASGALMEGASAVVGDPEPGSKAAGKRKAVGDVDPAAKRSRR
jgi:hypothetical protein